MPDYQYVAREGSGQQVTGILSAASERDALGALAGQKLFPLRIGLAEAAKKQQKHAGRRVKPKYLSTFYTQLSDLLRSGVPLLRSLELLERKAVQPSLKLVIESVREQVANGSRLADAMRQNQRVFGELAVSMVRAGEEGSFLEDVLKRIALFTDHQEELRSRMVGAMVYPMALLSMGVLIVSLMLAFFVPNFEPIFEDMARRGELPWATTTLMGMSDAVQSYGMLILIALVAGGVALRRWLKTENGRLQFDRFLLRAIGIGPVVHTLAISRFCRILGTLLKNGVPILHALRISKDATGNRVLSAAIAQATESVSAGKALARPLSASGEFPEEVVEMISVGEEANNLEQVLVDISENMERQTHRQVDLFVRLLEPFLLTIMAGVILFVVIALLLPIMQSSGAF